MTKETEPRVLSDAELDQVHGGKKDDLGNSGQFKVDGNKIINPDQGPAQSGPGPVNFPH